jgi:hypothetical protein
MEIKNLNLKQQEAVLYRLRIHISPITCPKQLHHRHYTNFFWTFII